MSSDMSNQFSALWLLMGVGEKYKLIETVDDAARLLIQHWPSNEGDEYIGALAACQDAIQGTAPADVAREALIRAADEALICYLRVVEGGKALNSQESGSSTAKQA
ncbi:DUF982 domain-containing protein [Pararhizobium sp. BT-229]|uniref:DUF982 domain-containing protein n=1 Tax=Pararhizobium sp. BT-229 TaxID=2986923 RepID=UPI0021F6AAF8|nr:DUF982 domain-containing protein [Pararhizobium sp. BT-229]MCV9963201.1 DUF982 domain-containing protein [Pararhizobium sp. BT-229]